MKELIQANPELALRQTVPYSLRKRLPESIKALLEEPISGRGKLSLVESSPLAGGEGEVPQAWYRAELWHKVYHAYLAGWKPRKTINGRGLTGISLDQVMAL